MSGNRFQSMWLPAIGLHALHQLEESIAFFGWYVANANAIAPWAQLVSVDNARTLMQHPIWFVAVSMAQIGFVSLVAFLSRRHEELTRYLLAFYVAAIAFFLIWHMLIAWQAQSYAPVMVTCLGGLFVIPAWLLRLAKG